jgi:hypothetical protein
MREVRRREVGKLSDLRVMRQHFISSEKATHMGPETHELRPMFIVTATWPMVRRKEVPQFLPQPDLGLSCEYGREKLRRL